MSVCPVEELLVLITNNGSNLTVSDVQEFLDKDGFDINKAIINTVYNVRDIPKFIISEAIIECDYEVIELLMQYKPKLNLFKEGDACNPISLAVLLGNVDVLKLLVKDENLDFDVKIIGSSPIEVAASFGYSEIVKIILDHYGETKNSKENCQKALIGSIKNNNYDVTKTLLESDKLDVNYLINGRSVLEFALHSPLLNDDIAAIYIKLLAEHGADIHKVENNIPGAKSKTILETVLSLETRQYDLLIEPLLSGYLGDVQTRLQDKFNKEIAVNAAQLSSIKKRMAKRKKIGGLKR